jgi:hypothetical protein
LVPPAAASMVGWSIIALVELFCDINYVKVEVYINYVKVEVYIVIMVEVYIPLLPCPFHREIGIKQLLHI